MPAPVDFTDVEFTPDTRLRLRAQYQILLDADQLTRTDVTVLATDTGVHLVTPTPWVVADFFD